MGPSQMRGEQRPHARYAGRSRGCDSFRPMISAAEKRKRPRKSPATKPPAPLRDWLAEYASKANLPPTALRSLRDWLAEQLVADEFAKLGQGGHAETRVPLRRVFVDLPITAHPGAEAQDGPGRALFLNSLLASEPAALSLLCTPADLAGADSLEGGGVEASLIQEGTREVPRGGIRMSRPSNRAGTLLIGGPGQGKSTLGQLACQLHRAALLQARAAELPTNVRDVLTRVSPFRTV